MSMPTNLKSRIMEIYQGLNKMEKLVAQKVLENPKKIIHMPINETADYCGVSPAGDRKSVV